MFRSARFRSHLMLSILSILPLLVAGGAWAWNTSPAVEITTGAYGATAAIETAEYPQIQEVENTQVNGAHTAYARARQGILQCSAYIQNGPDPSSQSFANCEFVEHYRFTNPGRPDNSYGDFHLNFRLHGTLRIHQDYLYNVALVSVQFYSMAADDPAAMLQVMREGSSAVLVADTAEGWPQNNLLAGSGGERIVYARQTAPVGGFYTFNVNVLVRAPIEDFIVNRNPAVDDWGNLIQVQLGTHAMHYAGADFSSTFEFTAQNPIVPDPEDGSLPTAGWGFTSATGEIELPAPLSVECTTGSGTALLSCTAGTIANLTALTAGEMPAGMPAGDYDHGFFSLDVTGLAAGEATALNFTLPADAPAGTRWWFEHPDGRWIYQRVADDDGDAALILQTADNGLCDLDAADGVLHLSGGLSTATDPTPVFLTRFVVAPRPGRVDVDWRFLAPADGEVTLRASRGSEAWYVPFTTADGLDCHAVDESAALAAGGAVTYSLRVDGLQLAGETVTVPSPATRSRLVDVVPNPFNPRTEIRFQLARAQQVRVAVHDPSGRLVAVLTDQAYGPGEHAVAWDGTGAAGRALPSGAYLVSLRTEEGRDARKISLVR